MNKTLQYICSAVFGVAVFLCRTLLYPYALGLQEQNQLFLFTWDYLWERIAIAGGLADYISEFITQFNFVSYLGEFLMAVVFVAFQRSIARAVGRDDLYALSFIPPVMMLIYMGDIYVLLSYMTALIFSVQLCICYNKYHGFVWTGIATVLGYWLIGPAVFIFTLFVCIGEKSFKSLILIALAVVTVVLSKLTYMHQYPWKNIPLGVNYYRMQITVPPMQIIVAGFALIIPILADYLPRLKKAANILIYVTVLAGGALAWHLTYDRDIVEIVAYDQLASGLRRQGNKDELQALRDKYAERCRQMASDLGKESTLGAFLYTRFPEKSE